jgi:hypothetical protein
MLRAEVGGSSFLWNVGAYIYQTICCHNPIRQSQKLFLYTFCWPCISVQFVLITNLMRFFNVFISLLYMFRATHCSSSGESIVSILRLIYITLCRWPSGMQLSHLHTRRPPTQRDTYQTMYWYNWFSWLWALGCLKHVQKWNKHIKKVRQVGY